MEKEIPQMSDPMGKYWTQPDRNNILIDDNHAVMSSHDFITLPEYSCSIPSGVYVGKMWKSNTRGGDWFLKWYGPT